VTAQVECRDSASQNTTIPASEVRYISQQNMDQMQSNSQSDNRYPIHLPVGSFAPEYETVPYTTPEMLRDGRSGWMDDPVMQQQTSNPGSTLPQLRPTDQQGVGTLLIGRAGRSKFLGPTAGSEWLNDVRRFAEPSRIARLL